MLLDVEEVELLALITEQKLCTTRVELQIVYLGVVVNGTNHSVLVQVLDADSHSIEEVSDNLEGLSTISLGLGVVKARRDEVRSNVLSVAGSNHLVDSILDDRELSSVEDHADVRVREVKLLIARATPWELTQLAHIHVSQEKGAVSTSDKVAVLVDVNLADFVSILRLKDDALAIVNSLDDDLG